jgi:hypothetical protein
MAPDLLEFECDDDENELGLRLDDRFSKQIDRSKKIRFNETTSTIDIQMTLSQPPPPPPLQTNLLLPAPQLPTASASTVVSPYLSGKLALQAQQVAAVMGATPSSKSKLLTSTSSHNNKSTLKVEFLKTESDNLILELGNFNSIFLFAHNEVNSSYVKIHN